MTSKLRYYKFYSQSYDICCENLWQNGEESIKKQFKETMVTLSDSCGSAGVRCSTFRTDSRGEAP